MTTETEANANVHYSKAAEFQQMYRNRLRLGTRVLNPGLQELCRQNDLRRMVKQLVDGDREAGFTVTPEDN